MTGAGDGRGARRVADEETGRRALRRVGIRRRITRFAQINRVSGVKPGARLRVSQTFHADLWRMPRRLLIVPRVRKRVLQRPSLREQQGDCNEKPRQKVFQRAGPANAASAYLNSRECSRIGCVCPMKRKAPQGFPNVAFTCCFEFFASGRDEFAAQTLRDIICFHPSLEAPRPASECDS